MIPHCTIRHPYNFVQHAAVLLLVAFTSIPAWGSEQTSANSHSIRLDSGWQYTQGDLGGIWEAVRKENSSELPTWQTVTLPHCFNALDSVDPYKSYYQGPGWYRRTLEINNPFQNGRTLIRFDGSGQKTEVFIGQTKVASHVGGYDEFTVDITNEVTKAAQSGPTSVELSVRCDNSRDLEMIPSDLSDFNLYGGLYRPVHLIYRPEVSAAWPAVTASVENEGKKGVIAVQIKPQNLPEAEGELTLIWQLFDPTGITVAEYSETLLLEPAKTGVATLSSSIANPELWSPETPALYSWKLTSIWEPTGESTTLQGTLGFRYFEFKKHGPFFLNGERLLLRGTHRHEDHAGVAAAQSDALIQSELKMMKEMGVNFIRLGHYQQYRKVLELCDELGILVWEEIPWCRGGLGGEVYQAQAKRMLTNMIQQHRHHPSVILWGLGNENDWPGDFTEFDQRAIRAFMKELHELAHQLDPTRMTSIRRCEFCADIVDVYSPSIWAGWYRGKYTDYKEVSEREMRKVDHFLHVEWGASHHARRHSENPDKGLSSIRSGAADERDGDYLLSGGDARVSKDGDWTETYACNLIDWHLKEQETMDWLTGTAYWPFKDFSTPIRPENPVPYVNQKGVTERDLTPKESYYVFQSYWLNPQTDPMLHIYGHTWPVRWGAEGEAKMVKVYSNCPKVELFLNGESLGVRNRDSQNFPAAGLRWIVNFKRGKNTLRAISYVGESSIEDSIDLEYQTEAWGTPVQLRLSTLQDSETNATVQVYAFDAAGIRCLDATNFVEFDIAGDGELIADLGTSTASRKVQLTNGRAQISIRKNEGNSVIAVKTKGLPTVFLNVD